MEIFILDDSERAWEKFLPVTRKLDPYKTPVVPDGAFLIVHDTDWGGWEYADISNKDSIFMLVISGSPNGAEGDGSPDSNVYHCYKRPVGRILENSSHFLSALSDLIFFLDKRDTLTADWYLLYPKSVSNLQALLILCQGYLAAHSGKRLQGWENLPATTKYEIIRLKEKTENPDWWSILINYDVTKQLFDELSYHCDKAVFPAEKLVGEIKAKKGVSEEVVENVYELLVESVCTKELYGDLLAKTKKSL